MSNQKKVNTLGMNSGSACSRLRKILLFELLKKHEENTCVRCHNKIDTVEELSVEHIKPWEGVSAELFWDLNNIGYSHRRCNVPHTRHGGTPQRKIGPQGTAWCSEHQKFESLNRFHKDGSNWNGVNGSCIVSRKIKRYNSELTQRPECLAYTEEAQSSNL